MCGERQGGRGACFQQGMGYHTTGACAACVSHRIHIHMLDDDSHAPCEPSRGQEALLSLQSPSRVALGHAARGIQVINVGTNSPTIGLKHFT